MGNNIAVVGSIFVNLQPDLLYQLKLEKKLQLEKLQLEKLEELQELGSNNKGLALVEGKNSTI
jgi:hypothetical protein